MSDYKTVDVTAQNQFTDEVRIPNGGTFIVEDTSSMSMTVTLQVKPDGAAGWIDSDQVTEAGAWYIDSAGELYRAGVKTGDFTSGTSTIHLKAT